MEKPQKSGKPDTSNTVRQEQIHDLLFNREIGWQEIIYDLINTEQLDPWDIDLVILSNKYLEKIQELEEDNFFISSKVLLAAALLLKIKSEILLNKYIKNIDKILFDEKETENVKAYQLERIELDEEIPELIPRTPLPRFRRVTLKELIESLNKAIITENRRIKKEITNRNALIETSISLPKKKFSLRDKVREIYKSLINVFREKKDGVISFTEFLEKNPEKNKRKLKEEKILSFYSLLHLESQKKIWLEQKDHFGEIYLWKKNAFFKLNPNYFKD